MNASKEEAAIATDHIQQAAVELDEAMNELDHMGKETYDRIKRHLIHVDEFIDAARRKLPSEAAFDRDAKRRSDHNRTGRGAPKA